MDVICTTLGVWGYQHTLTRMNTHGQACVGCKNWLVQVGGPHGLVMRGWMVLGEIIGTVGSTRAPVDVKLTLFLAVTEPIEAHVNCLGSFLFDRVIDDAAGRCHCQFEGVWQVVCDPSAVWMGQRAWALRKRAPSLASAALDKTWRIIWHRTKIGPLSGGGGS